MRRNAVIGALLLIVVGVALGATVFRTDIAQATGLAQAVTVDNTAANPVPVQQQGTANVRVINPAVPAGDVPARQHQVCVQVVLPNETLSAVEPLAAVPSGKRFVVEYASVTATLPKLPIQTPFFTMILGTSGPSGSEIQISLPATLQSARTVDDLYAASEPVLGYQDAELPSTPRVIFSRSAFTSEARATFCASGYLIDVPPDG